MYRALFGFGESRGVPLDSEVQGLLLSIQLLISISSKITPALASCSKLLLRVLCEKWVRISVTARVKHTPTSREFNLQKYCWMSSRESSLLLRIEFGPTTPSEI